MGVKRTKNKVNEAFLKTLVGRPFEIRVGIMSDPDGTTVKGTDKKNHRTPSVGRSVNQEAETQDLRPLQKWACIMSSALERFLKDRF